MKNNTITYDHATLENYVSCVAIKTTITKPMLAGKCERPEDLRFPILATPKLDGIRCLKIVGGR